MQCTMTRLLHMHHMPVVFTHTHTHFTMNEGLWSTTAKSCLLDTSDVLHHA